MPPLHELENNFKPKPRRFPVGKISASTAIVLVFATSGIAFALSLPHVLTPATQFAQQLAAAGAADVAAISTNVEYAYFSLCPFLKLCNTLAANNSHAQLPAPVANVAAAATPSTDFATATATSSNTIATAATSSPTIIQNITYPIRERVIEKVVATPATSQSWVSDQLTSLDNRLSAKIAAVSVATPAVPILFSGGGSSGYNNTFGLAEKIDSLSNTAINNPTITGGSITATSITGSISNAITSALATIDNLTANTLVATNSTYTNSTTTNATTTNLAVTGTATLPSTSVSGNLNVSGTLTAGALSVAALSSSGALTGPYVTATSTNATSTFAGDLIVSGNTTLTNATTSLLFVKSAVSSPNAVFGTATATSSLAVYGPASFGATATSSFAANGALTLSSALTVPSGGTGTTTWQTGSIPFFNGTNFTENNTNLFWDNTNGRLGIGTTTPPSALTLDGNATTKRIIEIHNSFAIGIDLYTHSNTSFRAPVINLYRSGGTEAAPTAVASNELGVLQFGGYNGTAYGRGVMLMSNAEENWSGATGAANFAIYTNPSGSFDNPLERVRVSSSGNVGIGTTSPGSLLSLNNIANFTAATSSFYSAGGLNLTSGCFAISGNCLTTGSLGLTGTQGQVAYFSGANAAVGTSSLFIATSGNVGIGTTSPASALQLGSGQIQVPAGSFTTPPYSFSSSTGTGIYWGGGGNGVAFSTAGTLVGYFNGSNALNLPTGYLILGANSAFIQLGASADAGLSRTGAGKIAVGNGINSDTSGTLIAGNVGIGTTNPGSKLEVQGVASAQSFNATSTTATTTLSGQLAVGSNALNVLANGNVGIGTASPKSILDLGVWGAGKKLYVSNGSNSPTQYFGLGNDLSDANYESDIFFSSNSSYGHLNLGTYDGTTFASKVIIQSNGNIGIGTTNPGSKLEVQGVASAQSFNATSTTATSTYSGGFTAGNNAALVVNQAAPANSLLVLPNGNIGIGTTNPSNFAGYTSLAVNNATYGGIIDIFKNNIRSATMYMDSSTGNYFTGTPGAIDMALITNGADRLHITASGSVGIGTTSPAHQLTTTGSVQFATFGAGTLTTDANGNLSVSSDVRLKNIQGNFTRGLDDLLKLNPILYHWNALSGLEQTSLYAGFSAQNVQSVIPEAVGTSSSGYLTLQDRPLIAAAVNAIKEIATITGTFKSNLIAWLGNAANGITDFFASNVHAKNKLCVGTGPSETCINQTQLAALLSQTAAAGLANPSPPTPTTGGGLGTTSGTSPGTNLQGSTTAPIIAINGNNPATIAVGATYADLGATITGPAADTNLGIIVLVDNATSTTGIATIDTTSAGTHTIIYTVTDPAGLTGSATRTVIVTAPANDDTATSSLLVVPPPSNDNPPPLIASSSTATSTTP